jgi:TonB family protein
MRRVLWIELMILAAATGIGAQQGDPPNQPSAPQPDKDGVYTLTHAVDGLKMVFAAPAVYPADMPVPGLEGSCILSAVIDSAGAAKAVQVLRPLGAAVDAAAIKAIEQSQFEPGKLDGKIVPIRIDLWLTFHADKSPALPKILPLSSATGYPVPLNMVEAELPDKARKNRRSGSVIFSFIVGEDGVPTAIQVVSSTANDFAENALKAVTQYRFKPAMEDGKPVPVRTTAEIRWLNY